MDQKKVLNMEEMEKVSGGSEKTVASVTQVRSDAGRSYPQLATLTRGTTVYFTGITRYNTDEGTNWYKISYSRVVGWVPSSALQ